MPQNRVKMAENPENNHNKSTPLRAYREHPRQFLGSQLVYPVLSRRSGGISIGVNLNPQKICNFNCLYCQVNRENHTGPADDRQQSTASSVSSDNSTPPTNPGRMGGYAQRSVSSDNSNPPTNIKNPADQDKPVELDKSDNNPISFSLETLQHELEQTLTAVTSGEIYHFAPFDQVPPQLRRLNDIALSGDGEPTATAEFLNACRCCIDVKEQMALADLKIILITNSSCLHLPDVVEALAELDKHNGCVWAKLDAGSEEFYQTVNQSQVPFGRILDNLLQTARVRPITIQSLFFRHNGQRTPPDEIAAYARNLNNLIEKGARFEAIQLYTVARNPRDRSVSALSSEEIDKIAAEISALTDIPLQLIYTS